jgi:raffinose/stachyose/melibiose transport system permease protein
MKTPSVQSVDGLRGRRRLPGLSRSSRIALLAVPLTLIFGLYVVPNLLNFAYSFTDWNSYRDAINFVGFQNFVQLWSNGSLVRDLRVTLTYAACVAVFQNVLGLAFALGLEKPTRSHRILRVILFIPVLLSGLAAGYLFQGILAYHGVLNEILSAATGSSVKIEWLASPHWTIVILAAIHAWKFFGISMLIYIAGLSAIPEELSEAAWIDGAGYWKTFVRIRWRLLAPAFTVNLALTVIGSLSAFDIVVATTQGGPGNSTQVLNMYVFQQFGTGAFGRATAMTFVLFVIIALIAMPLILVLRRRELDS